MEKQITLILVSEAQVAEIQQESTLVETGILVINNIFALLFWGK